MSLYGVALFLHILGAFGLIAALAIEATALRGLRSAETGDQARSSLSMFRALRFMAPASIALILLMGLYLMASAWGWRGWILSGLAGLLLVALIGGLLTGTRMARLGPVVGPARGQLTDEMGRMVRDPVLLISSRVRIGLVLGVLFLMSVKPSTLISVGALLIAALLGLASTQIGVRGDRRELHAQHG